MPKKPFRPRVLAKLFDDIAAECVHGHDGPAVHLDWAAHRGDGELVLHVWERKVEVLGGPDDGAEVYRGYHLDVSAVEDLLLGGPDDPAPDVFCCCAVASGTPRLCVSGVYRGRRVFVIFYSVPLPGVPATLRLHPDGTVTEKE